MRQRTARVEVPFGRRQHAVVLHRTVSVQLQPVQQEAARHLAPGQRLAIRQVHRTAGEQGCSALPCQARIGGSQFHQFPPACAHPRPCTARGLLLSMAQPGPGAGLGGLAQPGRVLRKVSIVRQGVPELAQPCLLQQRILSQHIQRKQRRP